MKRCRNIFEVFCLVVFIGSLWALPLTVPDVGAAETITLATTEWPPHFSPAVENDGYVSEISREAFKRAGYELEIAFMPWDQAVEGAKKGDYDGVMGISLTPERARDLEYTKPLGEVHLALIKRADSNIPDTYSSYQELTGHTVAVVKGYYLPKEFEEASFKLDLTDSDEVNVLKLLNQEVDLIIDYGDAAYYLIDTKHPEHKGGIKTLSPPLEVVAMHNTISKKRARSEEIVAAFNQGLESMKEDGTYEAILRKHGVLPVE